MRGILAAGRHGAGRLVIIGAGTVAIVAGLAVTVVVPATVRQAETQGSGIRWRATLSSGTLNGPIPYSAHRPVAKVGDALLIQDTSSIAFVALVDGTVRRTFSVPGHAGIIPAGDLVAIEVDHRVQLYDAAGTARWPAALPAMELLARRAGVTVLRQCEDESCILAGYDDSGRRVWQRPGPPGGGGCTFAPSGPAPEGPSRTSDRLGMVPESRPETDLTVGPGPVIGSGTVVVTGTAEFRGPFDDQDDSMITVFDLSTGARTAQVRIPKRLGSRVLTSDVLRASPGVPRPCSIGPGPAARPLLTRARSGHGAGAGDGEVGSAVSGTVEIQGRFYDRFEHLIFRRVPLGGCSIGSVPGPTIRRASRPNGRRTRALRGRRRTPDPARASLELDGLLPVAVLTDRVEQCLRSG